MAGKKRGKNNGRSRGGRPNNFSTILIRENEKYERYYNSLLAMPEDERVQFWEALRRDLPNSFRFTGSRKHALALQERLKDFYIPKITSIEYEGEFVEPPRQVPWYPDQLAWSMTTPRGVIRRFPPFASFQKFLVAETEVGNISRQEVVSMIPPLLLDVQPGMVVLDLCAAPGSKSSQLMEMIHAGEEDRMAELARKLENCDESTRRNEALKVTDLLNGEADSDRIDDDGRSTGLLIANDKDYKRAHLLIHQMKRLNSPNLLVTNHDASMYPSIRLPSKSSDGKPSKSKYLKFDRILADVPCSGDGTARKNVSIWKEWNPAIALGLYSLQMRILFRALQMLKVGGRLVYSTCSLNPVENEAVVSSVIKRCGGSSKVGIVDCSKDLPELKRYPGLESWSVIDKTGRIWENWKDAEEEIQQNPDSVTLLKIVEGMFPPTNKDKGVDLTRCMRVYPHLQDTGGFFITVLEKKSEIKTKSDAVGGAVAAPATPASSSKPQADVSSEVKQSTASDVTMAESGITEVNTDIVSNTMTPASEEAISQDVNEPSALKRGSEQLDDPEAKRLKVSEAALEAGHGSSQSKTLARPRQKTRQRHTISEESFKYLDPKNEEIDDIFRYYGVATAFPRDRFMVRNPEGRALKTIYYTSVLARDILVTNEDTGIKFVHCGVKMFVKQDIQSPEVCPWRIQMEGLPVIESWVGNNRVVKMFKKITLRKLLVEMFPNLAGETWKELGEIAEAVRDMAMGCNILRLEASDNEDGSRERMIFPIWRSAWSVNLMVPKEERRAVLLRLFDDDSPLINSTQKREAAASSKNTESTNMDTTGPSHTETNEAKDDKALPSHEEEEAIQKENLELGQQEQDAMNARESFVMAGDEEDEVNKTV